LGGKKSQRKASQRDEESNACRGLGSKEDFWSGADEEPAQGKEEETLGE